MNYEKEKTNLTYNYNVCILNHKHNYCDLRLSPNNTAK